MGGEKSLNAEHPFRVLLFYGIRWIMGLEESGPPVRAGKKVSGGHFFSSGESPVCRASGKQQEEETRWIMGLERPGESPVSPNARRVRSE